MTLPKNVDDIYPLSPMQHLMLLHAIASPGNDVLLNRVRYDIHGSFDNDAFRRAWEDLVARHDALRTAFLWEGLPQPLQVVRSTVSVPYRLVDLTSEPSVDVDDRITAVQQDDAHEPLTLGRAPLLRATVIRCGAEHHVFLWTIHHLVVDRWSHAVLFDELKALYTSHVTGQPVRLGPPTRFRDYVDWIARQDRAGTERFWREELSGLREPTTLAASIMRRGERATTTHAISPERTFALRDCATRLRTTPAAVLLSAAGLFAARRSTRDDVVLGVTVSGRPPALPGVEQTVGSFINNVPIRFRIRRDQPIDAWIRDVQRAQARRDAFSHASLGDVTEWSELSAARALFDTLLLINLSDDVAGEWPGISIVRTSATLDAGYPLILGCSSECDRLVLTLVHDGASEWAEQFLSAFAAAIDDVVTSPAEALVGELIPCIDAAAAGEPIRDSARAANAHRPRVDATLLPDALLQIWREILGNEAIGLDDDFFALGGTSLQAAQLFSRVERATGLTLPFSTLLSATTVRSLLAAIDKPVPRDGAIVHIRSTGTRAPLYAVPGITGNVVGFAPLTRELGVDQPFAAFESPGLDGRTEPLDSIERIASEYVRQLLAWERSRFHLLGQCWGAGVAFEMARQLANAGRPVLSLAMLDPAVLLRQTERLPENSDARFVRQRLELYWDEFRAGDWSERGRLLATKARRVAHMVAGGETRQESIGELSRARVEAANVNAITRYSPGPLSVRACVFKTARRLDPGVDPRDEWLSLIAPTPQVVHVPGIDSGDAISPAKVSAFATALRSWIDGASHER